MNHTSVFKSFLLLISIAVLFSSCGEEKDLGDDYIPGEDAQYMFHPQGLNTEIAVTEDGYYFLIGNYVFYTDKKTMKPAILCNKPDCLHEKEMDPTKVFSCNAFINPGVSNAFLALMDNRLYVVSGYNNAQQKEQPQLASISLDGTNRKTEFLLPFETSSMTLHRGFFYYVYQDHENREESYCQIMRHEIGKSKTQEECIFASEIQGGNMQDLLCRGNQLYFSEFGNAKNTYLDRTFLLDIPSGKVKRIFTKDDDYIASSPKIVNDRLFSSLFDTKNDQNYSHTTFFSTDLQADNKRKEFSVPSLVSSCIDENYLYGSYPGTGPEDKPENARIDFYDHTGTLKDSVEIPNAHWMLNFAPGDDQYIFLQYQDDTYTYVDLIQKKEIGSKNIKPISLFKMETSSVSKGIMVKDS